MNEQDKLDREWTLNRWRELGSPKPGPWALEAIEYWSISMPEMTEQLRAQGILDQMAVIAEHDAMELNGRLLDQGMHPDAAREIALKEYIQIDPPEPETQEEMEEGEENQIEAFEMFLASGPQIPMEPSSSSATPPPSPEATM